MNIPMSDIEILEEFPSGAEPLARGATAEVYVFRPAWILKLFYAGFDQAYVEAEARNARAVFALTQQAGTIRVPAVGAIVRVGHRFGLQYEFIEGGSMQTALKHAALYPLDAFARRLAQLQTALHAISLEGSDAANALPLQRSRLQWAIQAAHGIPDTMRAAALSALDDLQHSQQQLCHGDFHMNNILLDQDGQAFIIDWGDASRGSPLADVARTSLLIRYGADPDQPTAVPDGLTATQFEAARQQFNHTYLALYFELNPIIDWQAQLDQWVLVVAVARLSERLAPSEQRELCRLVQALCSPV
ncbi:MAG: aminoglycoside phosphotransferase family protein [Pseudomonadota bacterium]